MKKILSVLCGASAVLALASCGGKTTTTQQKVVDDLSKNVELKLNMAYGNAQRTVTYNQAKPLTLADGKTSVVQGQLKPMWQHVQKEVNATLVDVTIQDQKTKDMITTAAATGFSDAVVYGGSSCAENFMSYGVDGKFESISDLIDLGLMPDFEKYLKANPDFEKAITAYDGNIYHIPYIAEVGEYARDFHMRESWVKRLLDDNTQIFDTNTVLTTYYDGFWTGSNARTGENGGTVTPKTGINIQKKTNQNIITIMNGLSIKNGNTLANALINYIKGKG